MKKQKSYVVLIIAALLLIASSVFAFAAYRNSYQESVQIGKQLTEVKNTIKEIEAGNATGDLEALKASSSQLSTEKLAAERPYSYGLVGVFFSLFLLVKGILNAVVGKAPAKKADINRLAQAGLLAALSYIGFAYLKIDVPLGNTAFHFGNVFCVLAALLLGGYWGGLAGALGMTIGDLAVVCAEGVTVGALEETITGAAGKLLKEVRVFDIYRGVGILPGRKSVAFSLTFRADDRTLTDADIEPAMGRVLKALEQELNAVRR